MCFAYLYLSSLIADQKRRMLVPFHGQGLVEYALILVLIALVAIAAMAVFGGEVNGAYTDADSWLGEVAK